MVNQLLGFLAALGAAFCWATAPSLYVLGMKNTSPLLATAIRTSGAGLFSLFFAIFVDDFLNQWPFDLLQVTYLVSITFISMGIGDWLYLRCLKSTDVSFIIGIVNIYPLWTILLTLLFGMEQLAPLTVFSAIIIVSGVFLVKTTNKINPSQQTRPSSTAPENGTKTYAKPITLSFLASITWGVSMFGIAFSLQYFSTLTATAIRTSFVGILLFIPVVLHPTRTHLKKPPRSSLMYSILGGIVGLSIGSWLMLVAINNLGAARSSALFSVSPFFTALMAIIILKEKPPINRLGGILLVCLGVLFIAVS